MMMNLKTLMNGKNLRGITGWLICLSILFVALTCTAFGQDQDQLTLQQFFDQYRAAILAKDEGRAKQLVEHNRGRAKELAEQAEGEAAYLFESAKYDEALTPFFIANEMYDQLADKKSLARTYNAIGEIYRRTKKFDDAMRNYDRALKLNRESGYKEDEGSVLNNMALVYNSKKQYPLALSFMQQALEIVLKLDDKERQMITLNTAGQIAATSRAYQQAVTYLNQGLEIANQLGRKEEQSSLLNNLGEVYQRNGDQEKALVAHFAALKIRKDISFKEGEWNTLGHIGKTYESLGEMEKAISYYESSLEVGRELPGRDKELTALQFLGSIHSRFGNYQKALDYLNEALRISREINDKSSEGDIVNNFSTLYLDRGEIENALRSSLEFLRISREIPDKSMEGSAMGRIAYVYHLTANTQMALSYYQDALKLAKENDDPFLEAEIYNNLGQLDVEKGDYNLALSNFQESLKITTQTSNDKYYRGVVLSNIGASYDMLKDPQKALEYYREALKINREANNIAGISTALDNIANIYKTAGDYNQAVTFIQESLKNAGDKDPDKKWLRLANLGFLYEKQGRINEAIIAKKQSIELLEAARTSIGAQEFREGFVERHILGYTSIIGLLLKAGKPDEAFSYAERSKARSFAELLNEASVGVRKGVDGHLIEDENKLYRRLFVIREALNNKLSDTARAQLLEEQKRLEEQRLTLIQKLRGTNPRYAELRYSQPMSVKQVQQEALKSDEVLVEYIQGDEEIYVFIIGKNASLQTHIIKEKELPKKVAALIQPLNTNVGVHAYDKQLAYEVYKQLFQPLEAKITEANQNRPVTNLVVVPDGVLYYLPFEMLVVSPAQKSTDADHEAAAFLLSKYNMSYMPSATALGIEAMHPRNSVRGMKDLLALAPFSSPTNKVESQNVTLSTENLALSSNVRTRASNNQLLPYSGTEVETISEYFRQAEYKRDETASKAYFLAHAGEYKILHLATHGYLDAEQPMFSGVLFSDGILQTYEIFNLNINADMVVLSACETGLGKLKQGEGLVGLSRAFFYAGTPSLLVSEWSVADPSTAALMKRFYRNLSNGMGKAAALREAKLWMIKSSYHTDERGNVIRHDSPFYWAPFILIGKH